MKENRDFLYLQYNKIDWKNQEKTKVNSYINEHIIQNVILNHQGDSISIFDIGFGIGLLMKMLAKHLAGKYKTIVLEGCEPSQVNYRHFGNEHLEGVTLKIYPQSFLEVHPKKTFDYITAVYVFPHFLFEDLEIAVRKIYSMLNKGGRFTLIVANENYLQQKLSNEKGLIIEEGEVEYNGKKYREVLHYSNIPEIGKVIDYNREESLYADMFSQNGFTLENKEELDDNGFICSLFVFKKI